MTKKFHIILLIVVLGIFLIPTSTFACGTNSEKTEKCCCAKENSKENNKDCCKKHKQNKEKNEKSCDGKCKNSNCTTTSVHYSVVFFGGINFKSNFVYSVKKQKFHNLKTNLSSGFSSIWLIPKIG
ncbi:MAG: hypothetical protein PHC28_12050 [Flavobacterium sp.]|uniref:hypothetical protein n=1 Tax=Flavobacterium sp. TaxID=239 RepID=UPI00261AB83A|nr:hypothetical protein [Flavobacterium sp.]MDD5151186.1 hypothetical protein [Flavobacterium sp.]